MNVAQTILSHLGGNQFLAMTGARNLVNHSDALSFKLPRGAKDGIDYVKVTLSANDTYKVEFMKYLPRSLHLKTIASFSCVYADSLQSIFTSATGLDTRL
jgi:hypothetical protein